MPFHAQGDPTMKSIGPSLRTKNHTSAAPRRFKTVILLCALLMVVTAMAVSFDSVHSSSHDKTGGGGLVQRKKNTSVAKTAATFPLTGGWRSTLRLPWMAGESVTL